MRVILTARIPHDTFNAAVRDGSVQKKLQKILAELKPEATYFVENQGHRCAMLVINMDNQSELPKYAEPWFLTFGADCEFRIAMTAEDLGKARLDELGKKWA